MWTLVVFAIIGWLTGAAARLLYPGRRPTHILGTMLLGMIGALTGGMISWLWWPAEEGEYQTGNLLLAFLGGMIAIALWAAAAYKRRLSGYSTAQR